MPKGRKPKPARLWFREDEQQWCILDRGKQIRTGLRRDEIQAAEERFADYVGDKRTIVVTERDPARLPIADVILSYEQGKRPRDFDELVAREKSGEQLPVEQKKRLERHKELAYRLDNINTFFGARTVADIRKQLCGDYVDWRTHAPNDRASTFPHRLARAVSDQSARRELEDLRAAIGAWHAENMLTMVPVVSLPPKSEARKAWLTRSMAARLLGAALGFTFDEQGKLRRDSAGRIVRRDRVTRTRRRHAARFILIALYSGRREETARRTLWHATPTNPSFDLDRMVYHGRGAEELKTKKRRPPAKIATRLRPHLLRWHQLDRKLERELLSRGIQLAEAQVSHVIHRPDGRPLRGKIKTAWAGILEDASLVDEADKVVRHTLKHTAATWLMQAGTDRWQAAGFLGITVEQLEDGYGHHHPDFQDVAAAAFSLRRQA